MFAQRFLLNKSWILGNRVLLILSSKLTTFIISLVAIAFALYALEGCIADNEIVNQSKFLDFIGNDHLSLNYLSGEWGWVS